MAPGPRGVPAGNQYEHGVAIFGGTRMTVEDVRIDDVFGDGVMTAPSGWHYSQNVLAGQLPRDVLIQRVTIESTQRMCIGFTGGIGLTVQDSSLSDCRYAGVDLETDVPGEKLQNVKVLRNTISGFYLFAIGVAGPTFAPPQPDDISGIEIRGNITPTHSDTCWPAVNAERGPISNMVVAGNPDLKSQGDSVRLTDVQGGSVTANKLTLTKGLHWCASPSVPVRLAGTTTGVTVSGNTTVGY